MDNIINSSAVAMLYLCGCVLAGETPDSARIAGANIKELYAMSKFHSLTALVCEGLELAGYEAKADDAELMAAFKKAKEKSVRKNLMLDTERARIFAFMEQNGIWHMPLKGVILKDMYPKMGLRQMADNDILFDENYRENIRDWFLGQGYEVEAYGNSNHDVYLKEPIYNYEMHVSLYGEAHSAEWQSYYKAVKERLVKDAGNKYGYHFTDEDFYIYFLTHGFKHFDHGGTGLRFLLDMYIYLKNKQSTMDFAYIASELEKLGILAFEQNCRVLAFAIFRDVQAFSIKNLTSEQSEMLKYFLTSGTYGTIEQSVQKAVDKQGKFKYFLRRVFPGTRVLRVYHPIFRHKWLMPIGWIYRAVKILFSRSGRACKEFKALAKAKKK